MGAVVEAPRDLMEEIASLRLPPKANDRLQDLMDRNNEGALKDAERQELEALAEWSERISLVRAKALRVLGRGPV